MKINNKTSRNIVIVNNDEQILCPSNEKVIIKPKQGEIFVKSAEEKTLSSYLKVFKHQGKDTIKGNIIYFNPGFYGEYITKITLRSDVQEINIVKYDLSVNSLFICSLFLPKENMEKDFSFENSVVKKLFLVFVSLFAVPCCAVSGLFTLVCALGIIFAFDWTLIVATLISGVLLWAFLGVSRSLYRCADVSKNYAKILEDGKAVVIRENKKHFLSYVEEEYAVKEMRKIK